jgi:glutathione S-transferase
VPEVFGYLNAVAGDRFLAGDALSVADLAVMSNLVNMQYIGFALERARYPKLANLFDRVVRIPEVTETLRAEQPVVQQMGLKSEFLNAVLG